MRCVLLVCSDGIPAGDGEEDLCERTIAAAHPTAWEQMIEIRTFGGSHGVGG